MSGKLFWWNISKFKRVWIIRQNVSLLQLKLRDDNIIQEVLSFENFITMACTFNRGVSPIMIKHFSFTFYQCTEKIFAIFFIYLLIFHLCNIMVVNYFLLFFLALSSSLWHFLAFYRFLFYFITHCIYISNI